MELLLDVSLNDKRDNSIPRTVYENMCITRLNFYNLYEAQISITVVTTVRPRSFLSQAAVA